MEREIKSLWSVKNVGRKALLAIRVTRGVLALWRGERVNCKEVIIGEITISCLFENRIGGAEWVGVYGGIL